MDQPPAVGELGGAIAAAKAWWKNSGRPSSSASLPSRPTSREMSATLLSSFS
nr:hypothetical protein [Rhizobium laguerreae]